MIQSINSLFTSSSVVPIISAQPIKNIQHIQPETTFKSDSVKLTISPEAKNQSQSSDTTSKPDNSSKSPTSTELRPEEERVLQRLKQNALDVKTHEHQHVAAAGGYVKSGPVYNYTTGPDGKRYAVGGHVSLDMSSIPNNPEATINKAQIIKRAALAPANPSGADRAVAASASKMEMKAREQLRTEQAKNKGNTNDKSQDPKLKAYTRPFYQSGQAVNTFL